MPKYKTKHAFTLIECLISLFALSTILLSINLLIHQTVQIDHYLKRKDQKEWLIFLAQFEEEIKGGTNVVIKENRIHYEKKEKDFIVEQYQNMIRKREKAGGHQPMLTQVKKWEVRDSAVAIILLVEFENGEKNEGIWTKSFT
ncbi:competence type IV pilus minor pilin ComGF [Enterococcus villorum]|uniref:Competence protein ComGF n=2 Tax=Enterococcus villorum TaxID=112904 RepID=A0A511J3T6_9ENTE|nr:competence type IV pilus minor pilin ComGF [Enterococcus villorum]EOH92624.1 hypothetical protein UAO_00315 [Enterococcus villorum ATCC 700913]EOW75532.1 hypothetical protein I591_02625 [Enterococcus villorum ATCC 700913]GEL92678.1 competence protein ComGF [Enterococcus villorum]